MDIAAYMRRLALPAHQHRSDCAGAQRSPLIDVRKLSLETRFESEAAIRALCNPAYLGDHTALCRVLGQYKMFVDTRDIGVAPHLLIDGIWEMWLTEALVSLVRPGMVVADVGANLGYFTLLMADLVGAGGRVHAFEPNLRMVELLGRSLSVNGYWPRVSLHHVALGAEDGREMVLIVSPSEPKNGYMVDAGAEAGAEAVAPRVDCARMDTTLPWDAIDLAKIDVEGAEEMVWAGMRGQLDNGRLKTVLIEFASGRYADPAGFLRTLQAPGFALSRLDATAGFVPATEAQILAFDPLEDVMLVLQR